MCVCKWTSISSIYPCWTRIFFDSFFFPVFFFSIFGVCVCCFFRMVLVHNSITIRWQTYVRVWLSMVMCVRTHAAHRSFLLRLFSINNTTTNFMEKCIKLLYRTRSLLLRWNLDLDFVCLFFLRCCCWLVGFVCGWLFALRSSTFKCLFHSLTIIRTWLKWNGTVLALWICKCEIFGVFFPFD